MTTKPLDRTLREFTKADWDGWAGAERGPAGEVPLIGDGRVTQFVAGEREPYVLDSVMIADRNGIEVTIIDPANDEEAFMIVRLDCPSFAMAEFIARELNREDMALTKLRDLGFQSVYGYDWTEVIA
jgi:hypothetical protein